MRLALLCLPLGAAFCGAALTWTGSIRQPPIDRGSPHIRRATPHFGYTYPGQFASNALPVAQEVIQQPSASTASSRLPIPRMGLSATHGTIVNIAASHPPVFIQTAAPQTATFVQTQAAPQPTAPPVTKPKEFALRLDEPQWFFAAGRRIRIQLHDYGSLSIGVQIDYGRNVRLQKQTNSDPHEMSELTLIHQEGSVRVYHLNAVRAPIGCFLLRVIGDEA